MFAEAIAYIWAALQNFAGAKIREDRRSITTRQQKRTSIECVMTYPAETLPGM